MYYNKSDHSQHSWDAKPDPEIKSHFAQWFIFMFTRIKILLNNEEGLVKSSDCNILSEIPAD